MKKRILTISTVALFLFGTVIYATPNNNVNPNTNNVELTDPGKKKKDTPTIVGVASGNDNFSTLVSAVKAAALVETLNGDGPFTVFAPLNSAFEKLPAETLNNLLKSENKDQLASILTYHVISGEVMANDVIKAIKDNNGAYTVTTVQGDDLTLSLEGDSVMITDSKGNNSKIVMTDVDASNGVIHAIDTVIMPE